MTNKTKNRFFAKHAKSSAMTISLGIHAVFIVVALFFVAVTVIQKEDKSFEAKTINRPRMPIKKLQVPVNIKKKPQKPKLRKRIVAKQNLNQNLPDIKMPEISGVKGGIGSGSGDGLGGTGGIGFTMPKINLFGIKSSGEKICIILDSAAGIMDDKIGGIAAYTIIKDELVTLLKGLPPSTLFSVIVYERHKAVTRFPKMVPANAANVSAVEQWLQPLNAVTEGMGDTDYGVKTLGEGGGELEDSFLVGKFKSEQYWHRPVLEGMKQQADAVFILTSNWGNHYFHTAEKDREWDKTAAGKRWAEAYEKSLKLLEEENRERAEKGMGPKVIERTPAALNKFYFPDIERPPEPPTHVHTPLEFWEGFNEVRARYATGPVPAKSGIKQRGKRGKDNFSINIVLFSPVDMDWGSRSAQEKEMKFRKLTSLSGGQYRTVDGLEAIKSSVSSK